MHTSSLSKTRTVTENLAFDPLLLQGLSSGHKRKQLSKTPCSCLYNYTVCGQLVAIGPTMLFGEPIANLSTTVLQISDICTGLSLSTEPLFFHIFKSKVWYSQTHVKFFTYLPCAGVGQLLLVSHAVATCKYSRAKSR